MPASKKKSGGGAPPAASTPKTKRFRWIECKLYPDNPYHVTLFDYLRNIGQYQGCHILHDKDVKADGAPDKPHWHVVLYSDTRQITCKEVGGGRWLAETWSKSYGSFDAIVSDSGKIAAYLPPNWHTDYPVPVHSGKVKTFQVLTDAAGINDPSTFLLYMTHSDFRSMLDGKHHYEPDELKVWDNSPTIHNYLTNALSVSRAQSYELFEYADGCSSGRELIFKLYSAGRDDLVEYVRKNPQYVAKFLMPGR